MEHTPSTDPAMELLENPKSLVAFDLTKDKKIIINCIEPRLLGCVDQDEHVHPDDLKTMMKTPGGGVGVGQDEALAMSVEQGSLVTVENGIEVASSYRTFTVLDAHRKCRFVGAEDVVLAEQASPSERTMDTITNWDRRYRTGLAGSRLLLSLTDASARLQEHVATKEHKDSVVDHIDELFPGYPNVRYAVGENVANTYAIMHHPRLGLNHRLQAKLYGNRAQVYFDNFRAMRDEILTNPNLSRDHRGLLIGALTLRSAATLTKLGYEHPGSKVVEISPSSNPAGLEYSVEEV